MWLFPCCGEEAVGYSLYHRQSAWGGDAPQNLCLLTSDSRRFRALQCCFCVAVTSWWEGGTHPFLVERGFCFAGAFFSVYMSSSNVLKASGGKNWSYQGVELDFRREITDVWFVSMSFKSLKEFGVSAERLGSICKRWMARVQRSVCKIVFNTYILSIFLPTNFRKGKKIHMCARLIPFLYHSFDLTIFTFCSIYSSVYWKMKYV